MQEKINAFARLAVKTLARLFKLDPVEFIVKYVQVEDQDDLNRLLELLVITE